MTFNIVGGRASGCGECGRPLLPSVEIVVGEKGLVECRECWDERRNKATAQTVLKAFEKDAALREQLRALLNAESPPADSSLEKDIQEVAQNFNWWMYSVPAGHVVIVEGHAWCEEGQLGMTGSYSSKVHYPTPEYARRVAAAALRKLADNIESAEDFSQKPD